MGKAYYKGYVQGTFDMFHIGHLILLERAKERCEHLVVGVVSDELSQHYKGSKPYIPYEDRADIVAAIKYVDEVIRVDFENEDKKKIFEDIHFDCHFCGDDHPELIEFGKWLRERGSNVELFPYTQRTSSTRLKQMMEGRTLNEIAINAMRDSLEGKVAIYGAGNFGQELARKIPSTGRAQVISWSDREYERLNEELRLGLATPEEMLSSDFDTLVIAIKNRKTAQELIWEFIDKGVPAEKIRTI